MAETLWVATPADVAVNSLTDITIITHDVSSAAGDSILVDAWGVIVNDSTATRALVFTLDFDAAFDIEFTTGALATSTTLFHPFHIFGVCDIRSTSLAYGVTMLDMQLAAGMASGADTTAAATHLQARGWGTSASNLTGTTTVALLIRSPSATATQTCRLHGLSIRVLTPG